MSTNETNENNEFKEYIKTALEVKQAYTETFISKLKNDFPNLNLKVYEIISKIHVKGAGIALDYDNEKSLFENVLKIGGDEIQGLLVTGAVVVLSPVELSAISAFAAGYVLNEFLKHQGIDLGKAAKSAYVDYIDSLAKMESSYLKLQQEYPQLFNSDGSLKGETPSTLNGSAVQKYEGLSQTLKNNNIDINKLGIINKLEELKQLENKVKEFEKQLKEHLEQNPVNENNPIKVELNKDNSIEIRNTDNTKSVISNGVKTNYDANNNQVSSVILKSGQTISHIAVGTKFNSLDLLEYNDLTLEQAKKLPIGYEVLIPKDLKTIDTEYGRIKIFDRADGTNYILIPNSDGTKTKLSTFIDGNNEYASYEQSGNGSIIVSFNERMIIANNDGYHFDSYGLENKLNIDYKQSDNGNLEVKSFTVKSSITLEELLNIKTSLNLDDVAFVNNLDKNIPLQVGQQLLIPKGESVYVDSAYGKVRMIEVEDGSYLIESPNEDGTKTIYATSKNAIVEYNSTTKETIITLTDENGNVIRKIEQDEKGVAKDSADINWNGVLNTAINQIGSLVIMNNQDFSNVEKILVSTTVATIADFATYKGIEKFNTTDETISNLEGAVVSFAISSFFAKNDTLGDILGMDGTFVGDFADFTVSAGLGYATGMYIVSDFNTATTWANMNKVGTNGLTSLQAFSVGAVGGYLGNAFANKVMGWDTKEEALGAAVGSAIGSAVAMMAVLMASGPVGWIAAVFVAFGGSAIGNVIGGIIGGLFGGSKPPPPKAHAEYEFDEDSLSYNLISSGSSDGGNEKAMIDIGKSLAKHLENMFNIPGGQLVNSDFLPDIKVNQKDKRVKINGERGTFDTVSDMLGNVLIQNIPFINVENGDPYILRAINRTNEAFLETDIHSTNRANLEELYENISLASDYSKYKSETVVLVDKNGNLITDTTKLLEINTLFQAIQNIQDEKEKEKALKEFLEEYNFITQKDYVDKLLKENNPEKQDEIDHWKKVFEKVEELQLDTHHYSEDFNKLNSEISKYNYEQSELKGLNNTNYKNNKIFKKVS
ncbi:hypothetical protein [Aliarcobacter butzleri]|uniref:hypothetical protein n=1 Tax=Aliarcobacter butzleri TaxID=28197 RepID=UPI000F481F35|nr:hypothetical protein [Aliarcobacter butzleri]